MAIFEKDQTPISKKNNLTYPVLCDLKNKVTSSFGLVFDLPDELKEIYQTFGFDLERFNGDNSWQLPMPARFIVNSNGLIIDAEVNPDYTVRPDPAQIINILNRI